jgi:hypothetical protein
MTMLSWRFLPLTQVNVFDCMIWVVGPLLLTAPVDAQSPQATRRVVSQVEEIYIARSVAESQNTPTEFCASAKTGLGDAMAEYRFSFRSVSTNTSDGRLLNTNVKTVGSFHGCFGPTANPMVFNGFAEVRIGSKSFIGKGECRYVKSDFPERGINAGHCFLDLSDPDAQYVGGLLTTNSITSLKDVGLETDPPGYTQASIATIRVWKKRFQR